jgi:hypothetical protein
MDNLRSNGYDPTDTECSFCEEGELWVNSFELVCDNCGGVVRKGESEYSDFRNSRDNLPTYNGSGKVVLPGAHCSTHHDEGIFNDG